MSQRDQLEIVIQVACLTRDRSPGEQRAMLDVAHKLDQERYAFTVNNPRPAPPEFLDLVVRSWSPGELGRKAAPTASQVRQQERMKGAWVRCGKCGNPAGAHYKDDVCPYTPHDLAQAGEIRERVWGETQ